MIDIKNRFEIEKIRTACQINAAVHDKVASVLAQGISTREVDAIAQQQMKMLGGKSSFREQFNYPGAICISVNDEIGHGVPGSRVLEHGDVVKIDIGVEADGFHSDCAKTYIIQSPEVGTPPEEASHLTRKQHLVDVTRQALAEGLAKVEPGRHLSDISHTIGQFVEEAGLSIVKKAHGHGIGKNLHEDPQIPNYGPKGKGPRLRPGMVLAIEPVVVDGNPETALRSDGWTEITLDGSLGAHFEHTILVTSRGCEILTASHQKSSAKTRLRLELGLDCRRKRAEDNLMVLQLAKQEMDPILLEAWGRPVHPREILDAPASTTYVFTDEMGVVRAFCIYSYRRPYLHLNTIVVDKSLHGTGVAGEVMNLIDEQARMSGMAGVELWVQTNNHRAIHFYEKLGFKYNGQPYFRTWAMQKPF